MSVDQIKVTIPLPPKALHPNARPHWGTKARAAAQYRRDARLASLEALGRKRPRWARATIQATFYHRTTRSRLDGDNALAAIKAALDALQDAGVLATDRNVTHLPVVQMVDAKNPRVELMVEEGT